MESLRIEYHCDSSTPRSLVVENRLTAGRTPENDLVLPYAEISVRHAIFEKREGRWTIRDLGSKNGVWVNGHARREANLEDGDELRIGRVYLRVKLVMERRTGSPTVQLISNGPGETIRTALPGGDPRGFRISALIDDDQELRRDYEKLRVAHELSLLLHTGRDPEALLDQVLSYCLQVLPVDTGIVLLAEGPDAELEVRAVRYRSGQEERVLLSKSVLNRVRRTGEALLVDDAIVSPDLSGAASVQLGSIRSLLAVPLVVKGAVHGVLVLDSRSRPGAFEGKDLDLLTGIATQASLALERTALLRDVEGEVERRLFLSRFLSPALVTEVQAGRMDIATGPQQQDLVVLYADLRSYTSLSERLGPEATVELLNEVFGTLESVIHRFGGVLDKYVGDALMAYWGFPFPHLEDAIHAVSCALEMPVRLHDLGELRKSRGLEPVEMGVAVHAGQAVVGCVGSPRRLDFTANGDTVNLAARLSGVAGPGEVLVSAEMASRLDGFFSLDTGREIRVKGRNRPVVVHRVHLG